MDRELRHLTQVEKLNLFSKIPNEAWRLLIDIIPKNLTSLENPEIISESKYSQDHVSLVENAITSDKTGSEILLEEWSTSGKERPKINHLLLLLIKTKLYRAADYVSVNILKQSPVERPSEGPAKKIDIVFPDEDLHVSELATPNTSSLDFAAVNFSNDTKRNKDYYEKRGRSEKAIEFESVQDYPLPNINSLLSKSGNESSIHVHVHSNYISESSSSESQNTQFKNTTDNLAIPGCSDLLANPCIQQKRGSFTNTMDSSAEQNGSIRTISTLDGMPNNNSESNQDAFSLPVEIPSIGADVELNLPAISALNIPDISMLNSESYIPAISALNVDSKIASVEPADISTIDVNSLMNSTTSYDDSSSFPDISALNVIRLPEQNDNMLNIPDVRNSSKNLIEFSGQIEDDLPNLSGLNISASNVQEQNEPDSQFNIPDISGILKAD